MQIAERVNVSPRSAAGEERVPSLQFEPTRAGGRARYAWLGLGCMLAAIGCSDDATGAEPPGGARIGAAVAALERVASCDEAASAIRHEALARMNERIDRLEAQAVQSASSFLGCPTASTARVDSASSPAPAAPTEAAMASSGAASDARVTGASATSMTNNQVAGVDEADFIKNDAKYVYTALNGALRIVDAWPAAQAHEVANVKLDGTPKKLFVVHDRALVYVSVPRTQPNAQPPQGGVSHARQSECSYGYDCQFGGDGTATAILVFDIADRAAPKQLRRIDLSGSLLAARRIGNAVHTVVVTPELVFPGLSFNTPYYGCSAAPTPEQIRTSYETLRERNTEIINTTPLANIVPSVVENGSDYAANSCQDVYRETKATGSAFTTLVSLDMVQDGAPSISTVISKPGAVYASGHALYMAVIQDKPAIVTPQAAQAVSLAAPAPQPSVDFSSAIHKFRIGEDVARSAYLASGQVKGHVLNQFSMDEYQEHLRVATSWGKVPSPSVHSTLSVLTQRADSLEIEGVVDNIAPGEDIRSVRFDGERGFVVTFKKTDPLYVFDLSKPTQPAITGELKIPGFSTYMHMLDEHHLLTIGYDAADQGNFAFFTGVLLQIFDVSDLQDPKLAHKIVIGTRGTSSEALTNHLAFTLFQGKLAVPMTICEGGGTNGMYGTNMTFSGLIVYDVSVEQGISERGRVAHPASSGTYNNTGCTNWWTRANSVVQRSVFMDDFVYSVANDVMHIQNVNALGSDVAAVGLTL